ncbi:MAG: hypothetical protein QOI78_7402, partial [Actinomycetota bacterium]|nr:hypothetical protein [Actinomycetota bacterium]
MTSTTTEPDDADAKPGIPRRWRRIRRIGYWTAGVL